MNIRSRLERVNRALGDGPCVGCSSTPRVFAIRNEADQARFDERMRWRAANCTCNKQFHVKTIFLRHGSGDPLPPPAVRQ